MSTLEIGEAAGESFVWDENHFDAILKERQEAETPAEPVAVVAEGDTPPADPPTPTWRDAKYPDADEAHGWYKGKTLGEVDDGIRRLEGTTSEANHRAKLAEAKALAAETATQMLQERLRKLTEQLGPQVIQQATPAAPAPDAFQQAGITDFDAEWVLQPTKVKDVLERDILEKADKRAEARTEAALKQWSDEQKKQRETDELASIQKDMENQARKVAAEALTESKVPQEYWERVLDYVIPTLVNPNGEYLQKGGILEKGNYLDVISKDPILRAGIQQMAGSGASAPREVPGVKSAAPPSAPPAPSAAASLSREVRDIAVAQARIAGITDGPDLEAFIEEVGTKIQNNRRRKN